MVNVSLSVLTGTFMRHDWIFEFLTDLQAYAEKNGLHRLAASAVEALAVAREEIDAAEPGPQDDATPRDRRRH